MLSDGVFGGVTSGPAPPPRGNRAGANEAGLLARGAVAGLPGIAPSGRVSDSSVPLTVAGPRRYCTGLPGGRVCGGAIVLGSLSGRFGLGKRHPVDPSRQRGVGRERYRGVAHRQAGEILWNRRQIGRASWREGVDVVVSA